MKVTEEMIDAADKALEAYMQAESPPMDSSAEFNRWHRAGYRVGLEAAIAAAHPNANRIEIELGDGMLEVATVTAFAAVLGERLRQVRDLGYDARHDDCLAEGALARAAACYADNAARVLFIGKAPQDRGCPIGWPFDDAWWKPTQPRRDLVKAGALILAEFERLDRAARCAAGG